MHSFRSVVSCKEGQRGTNYIYACNWKQESCEVLVHWNAYKNWDVQTVLGQFYIHLRNKIDKETNKQTNKSKSSLCKYLLFEVVLVIFERGLRQCLLEVWRSFLALLCPLMRCCGIIFRSPFCQRKRNEGIHMWWFLQASSKRRRSCGSSRAAAEIVKRQRLSVAEKKKRRMNDRKQKKENSASKFSYSFT